MENPDLKTRLKALTQPLLDSADAKLQEQVERHLDTAVEKAVTAALDDRLAVVERAIADLDRRLRDLENRS